MHRQKARQQSPTASGSSLIIGKPASRAAAHEHTSEGSAEEFLLHDSTETLIGDITDAEWPHWDEDIHLPPWILSTEKAQIEQHLQDWADKLLEVRTHPESCSSSCRTLRNTADVEASF